jgi:CHAT domain-containing protein/tetratricopeptide (TPR) repeat protein
MRFRMTQRASRHRGIGAGVLIALAAILVGAVDKAVNVFEAPAWLVLVVIAGGALTAGGAAWYEHVQQDRAETEAAAEAQAEWKRRLSTLLALPLPIPRVEEIRNPYGAVGVSMSKYAEAGQDPYVARDVDGELEDALRTKPFVLLIGDSKAGKSRTAFEAARRVLSDRKLVVPQGGQAGALSSLFGFDPLADLSAPLDGSEPTLLWLDDLDRYLGSGGLEPRMLETWESRNVDETPGGFTVVVLATIRSEEHERRRNTPGEIGRAARLVLDRAHEIFLDFFPSNKERAEAERLYPDDHFEGGIGERLVAARELIRKFETGSRRHPVGVALVRAGADWQRAGLARPIPESDLADFYLEYLRPDLPAQESYEDGLEWACEPLEATVALLNRSIGDARSAGFDVFDRVVSHIDRQQGGNALRVPEPIWKAVVDRATPQEAIRVSYAAYARDNLSVAEEALNKAVTSWELKEPLADALGLLHRPDDLARTLRARSAITGSMSDLDRAIEVYEIASQQTSAASADYSVVLSELGSTLLERYALSGSRDDLDKSITFSEEALNSAPSSSPEVPRLLAGLGSAFHARYALTGAAEDLNRAITISEEVIDRLASTSSDLPAFLRRFGNTLRLLWDRTLAAEHLERGVAAYRAACEYGLRLAVEEVLETARAWGDWATLRLAWREAAEAYSFGLEAVDRLVRAQLLRQNKEVWLQAAQGLPARAAYAFAKNGEPESAVLALERGRAVLLSEAVERNDLERLKEPGHRELYERFRAAEDKLIALEHIVENDGEPTDAREHKVAETQLDHSNLQPVRAELEDAILAIREVPEYERFRAPFTFADIQAVADVPLAYIAATEVGGLALIVRSDADQGVTTLWLPRLTEAELRDHASRLLTSTRRVEDIPTATGFDNACRWLGQVVMQPLIDALAPSQSATIVPLGALGLFPLAAAFTDEPTDARRRRYAIDALTLASTPSARALVASKSIASRIEPDSLLAVASSGGDDFPLLPGVEREVETVLPFFDRYLMLGGKDATRAAVLDAIDHYTVVHIAGHGFADRFDALSTGVLLANDERLSLRDLLHLRLGGVRLAVVSASEAAFAGEELVDETVSLASGLLQIGVAGVIAPLWNVTDTGTADLILSFYQRWREEGLDPRNALRQAQISLRDAEPDEPGAHDWAAFVFLGV